MTPLVTHPVVSTAVPVGIVSLLVARIWSIDRVPHHTSSELDPEIIAPFSVNITVCPSELSRPAASR